MRDKNATLFAKNIPIEKRTPAEIKARCLRAIDSLALLLEMSCNEIKLEIKAIPTPIPITIRAVHRKTKLEF